MLVKKDRDAVNQYEITCIDDMVPPDHFLRAVQSSIDFSFIYEEVKDLYSQTHGRPSIDPVVLVKILMLQVFYGIRSMRQTIQDIEVNVAYRWFLGYGFSDKIPHFSTLGKNYVRRFQESRVFEKIFQHILEEAIACGFVQADAVFIDSTHVKANANKNKHIRKMARHRVNKYKRELLHEINQERAEVGKKAFDDDDDDYEDADNEAVEDNSMSDAENNDDKGRMVRTSTTDPESGLFYKGEKERCFAYGVTVACDRNNFILASRTVAGNVHDSQVFPEIFTDVSRQHPEAKDYVLDAGYKTPAICREIIQAGKNPIMPYKRPMTAKGYFKKYEYVYDEYYDCYLCPNDKELRYSTTNRSGYREYKSDPKVCCTCPLKMKCTRSKNNTKVVTRHVWESFMETAEDLRHTPRCKDLYKKRGETIERVFADAKEKHGMRYTHYRGRRKVQDHLTLLFACMNLKKLALWKQRQSSGPTAGPPFAAAASLAGYILQLTGKWLRGITTTKPFLSTA